MRPLVSGPIYQPTQSTRKTETMGQAKHRGTYEERRQKALARQATQSKPIVSSWHPPELLPAQMRPRGLMMPRHPAIVLGTIMAAGMMGGRQSR